MRVAVVGAGITGLVAAYRLSAAGHRVDVYERWPGLGGQVATLDLGDGDPIERYYHHLFTSDIEIAALYEELGLGGAIEWLPSSVAVFAHGGSHAFTTPLDLLRFAPLRLRSRLRMGLAVLWLQRRHTEAGNLEDLTAREWIERYMGDDAWSNLWGPLLRGKFGDRAEEISMAWLWSKLTLRRRIEGRETGRELLGYPRGGWQPLLDRLVERIRAQGGRVLVDRPVRLISRMGDALTITPAASGSFRHGHDPRSFAAAGEPIAYDSVLATVPNDVFERLLDRKLAASLAPGYLGRIRSVDYHTALCVLLELERSLTPYYWTNIADPSLPFVGVIEHTNLVGVERYGGRHLAYVANYLDPADPLLELDFEALLARYMPGLRRINRGFSRRWVRRFWAFREPAAQPIVTPGYRRRIADNDTGAPGLWLANTTQIYPEDRGTNYSVRLGDQVARLIDGEHNGRR